LEKPEKFSDVSVETVAPVHGRLVHSRGCEVNIKFPKWELVSHLFANFLDSESRAG